MNTTGAARVVTEVLSPVVVVVAVLLAVAWHATGNDVGATLGWVGVVALFYSVIPMLILVYGAKRGRWDGHWVRDREHRFVPLVLSLVSAVAGLAVMILGDAPREVIALALAMIAAVVACMVITRWWKVSIHATVAGGAAAMVIFLYGPWLLLLVLLVALVCWSRVVLTDHTVGQVVVGAILGPVVGGAVFLLVA